MQWWKRWFLIDVVRSEKLTVTSQWCDLRLSFRHSDEKSWGNDSIEGILEVRLAYSESKKSRVTWITQTIYYVSSSFVPEKSSCPNTFPTVELNSETTVVVTEIVAFRLQMSRVVLFQSSCVFAHIEDESI